MPQSSGKALGRGLDALLPDTEEQTTEVALERIIPSAEQPRTQFRETELLELAHSIRQHGLLQPLVVATETADGFRLIAGERRLRASKLAGLTAVPVVVRSTERQAHFELALVENLQRADLTPVEEGKAYAKLLAEADLTQEALAKRLGRSRSKIALCLRLLALPDDIQQSITNGEISAGHAQALLKHEGTAQQRLLMEIREKGLSVRQAEHWNPDRQKRSQTETASATPWLRQLELALGTQIRQRGSAERGQLVIAYHSAEELSDLVERLTRAGRQD